MRRLLVLLLTLAVAAGAFIANAERAVAQAQAGSFVDSLVFFEQPNAATALAQVSRGTAMQLYMFNLRTLADKLAALGDPNIWTVQTPGSVNDLWLNPVPHGTGISGYNPFQLQAVRRALNYLIDRDFIINEIYGGFGIPYISPWHSKMPEYRREAAFFQQLDLDFSYDPQRANTEITAALNTVSGMAKGTDGKWRYNGQLLTVKFVIRIEDIRFDIGNYVADQLEGIGFTVERDYSPGAEAFAKVYNGPPDTGIWHLYTEGFAFTSLVAWQDDWIAGFYTDFSGETVWELYDAPAALVTAANTLLNGQYTSLTERQGLIRTASQLAVQDGVRVWMVAENTVFIYNKAITSAVNDLMAGPWGLFTSRTARYATEGGQLLVGQPLHWNSQWNTYRGFTWLYDATQQRALTDPGVLFHPSTGLPIAIRTAFTVATAGPTSPTAIPAGALIYNATQASFQPVPSGTTAISKVTYNLTFGTWHDGTPVTMDDIWYTIANFHRREGGTDRARDPYNRTQIPVGTNPATQWPSQYPVGDIGAVDPRADSPVVNQWLGLFKGARQVDADTFELYADYWHVDNASIAYTMDIFPALPWQVHELQVQTVLDDETRLDENSAQTAGKPVVDLIRGATIGLMNADLPVLAAANHVPPASAAMGITTAEATARWAALDAFRLAHNHYYVSNGPFYLDVVNVGAKQSVMSRFDSYPFSADKWDTLLATAVPVASIANIPQVVPGLPTDIGIATTLLGVPTSNVQINYLIRNVGLDTTVLAGAPTSTGTGQWAIKMDQNTTAALIPGAHEVTVTVLGQELGVPVTVTRAFIVIPELVYFEQLLGQLEAQLGGLQDDLDTANDQLATANAQVAALSGQLTAALAVAVVAIIVSVVSIALGMRRGPRMKPPEEAGGGESM